MAELLLLGQVEDVAAPSGGAAELYVLSDGFGQPTGTDTPLLVETPDVPLMGDGGKGLLRRILVPFDRAADCTVTVTPIVDFGIPLTAKTVAYASPASLTRTVLIVPVARQCTYLRVRIEVPSRGGLVRIMKPTYLFRPLKAASPLVVATGI